MPGGLGNGGLPQQGRMNVEGLALERNIGLRSWLVLGLMARGEAEQGAQSAGQTHVQIMKQKKVICVFRKIQYDTK